MSVASTPGRSTATTNTSCVGRGLGECGDDAAEGAVTGMTVIDDVEAHGLERRVVARRRRPPARSRHADSARRPVPPAPRRRSRSAPCPRPCAGCCPRRGWRRPARSVVAPEIGRRPVGIELAQEQRAPLVLVLLADPFGHGLQAGQAAEEAAIGRVAEPNEAGTPPAGLTKSVEATVIADPEGGISLGVVASQATQMGPGIERSGPAHDDVDDPRPLLVVGARTTPRPGRCAARARRGRGSSPAGRSTTTRWADLQSRVLRDMAGGPQLYRVTRPARSVPVPWRHGS